LATPVTARWHDSVPPAVKMTPPGLAPTKAATSSRASSTARRASRAAWCEPDGLPTTPCCHGAIASATSSRRGADAAWSK
jgi:hypothetical protein